MHTLLLFRSDILNLYAAPSAPRLESTDTVLPHIASSAMGLHHARRNVKIERSKLSSCACSVLLI